MLWTRALPAPKDRGGSVRVGYRIALDDERSDTDAFLSPILSGVAQTSQARDFTVKVQVQVRDEGLRPGTKYRYRFYVDGKRSRSGRSMLEKSRETRKAETGGGPAEWSADRPAHGPGALVRRHALVSYHALAYFVSWLVWLPYVLSQHGLGILDIPFPEVLGTAQLAGVLPGAYLGPLGAAFLVTAVAEGRPGLRRWRGRLFRFGVGWRWYALALIGVPAVLVAGTLVLPGAAAGLRFPPLAQGRVEAAPIAAVGSGRG